MTKIYFEAVDVNIQLPPHSQVQQILIAGRLPMMAMLYPTGKWMTMGMAQATEITENVTHWFKKIEEPLYTKKEVESLLLQMQ